MNRVARLEAELDFMSWDLASILVPPVLMKIMCWIKWQIDGENERMSQNTPRRIRFEIARIYILEEPNKFLGNLDIP